MLIGHNNPPDMTVVAGETATALSDWMKEHPTVQSEEDAREAKVFLDRARLCVKDLDAERTAKVKPLNDQVDAINDHYRGPKAILGEVGKELARRIQAFMEAEEAKRIAAAEEAARKLAEAERIAREAEAAEQEALASAAQGELGVDVKDMTEKADQAFKDYKKAERQVARAERDTKVKIGGGFGRAIGLKAQTTLVVVDHIAAINAIGLTEQIAEAIVKGARAYHKLYGEYPAGIEAQTERKV